MIELTAICKLATSPLASYRAPRTALSIEGVYSTRFERGRFEALVDSTQREFLALANVCGTLMKKSYPTPRPMSKRTEKNIEDSLFSKKLGMSREITIPRDTDDYGGVLYNVNMIKLSVTNIL